MTWVQRRGTLPLGNTDDFHKNVDYVSNWEATESFVKDFRRTLKSTLSTRPHERKRSSKSVTFGDERKHSLQQRHSYSAKSEGKLRFSDVLDGIDNMTVNKTPSDWVAEVMDYQRQPPTHFKHSIYCEVLGNKNCFGCAQSQKRLLIQEQRNSWALLGFQSEDENNLNIGQRSKAFPGPFMREISWAPTVSTFKSDDILDENSERDKASGLSNTKEKDSLILPKIQRSSTNLTDHELHMRVVRSRNGDSKRQDVSSDSARNRCRYNTNEVNIKFSIKK